ncbi:MAG: sugar phosphate isomerase/epimerase [Epulopiscium sp.]|nr:sugar phosphate isomerase/epimerase [Candidatus Epulonipiscium sp.]
MKTAIFSLIFKDLPLEEAIPLIKEIGYEGIELWGKAPHFPVDTSVTRAKEIRSLLDEHQLVVPAIGAYLGDFSMASDQECEQALQDVEKYFRIMEIIDCDMLRVGCGGPHAFLAEPYHYEKALHWIKKCGILGKEYGKKVVMEIHNGSLIETIEAAKEFMDKLDCDHVGLIHDAGNMYITDTDYGQESVDLLGDYIFHVHVKDEKRIQDDSLPGAFHNRTIYGDEIFQQSMLGEGAVDHIPLFKALLQRGYDGFLSCESHAPVPPLERAKREWVELTRQIKLAKSEL